MTISITKPTVGGSENTWGTTINTALDDVVDVLNGDTASTPDLTAGSWKVGGTAVTADAAEINKLDGFTGDAADLNYAKDLRATGVTTTEFDKLDGLTASTSELNKLDGLTASTSELNKLDGVTATATELNYTDGVTSNIQTQLNAKASTSTSISAGGGLTGGGSLASSRTISHSNTSSQGSVNNSGTTVIQDISVDTYGHVTSIGSVTLSIPPSQSTSFGAVGTYAYLLRKYNSGSGNSNLAVGSTISGSGVGYWTSYGSTSTTQASTVSGTWRNMGMVVSRAVTQADFSINLFVRIS
jgi:hypothetical protein